MAKDYHHFIPVNDGELSVWVATFSEKVAAAAALLNIPAARITLVQDTCQTIRDGIQKQGAKKQEYQEAIAYKRLLRRTHVKELVSLAMEIKRMPVYTENIGRELGIIGVASAERKVLRPTLKLKPGNGFVAVQFNKQRQTGVSIFTRLRGQQGWEKLVSGVTRSPFIDDRPLEQPGVAEIREYLARYWDNATEVGQESDIVFTLFGG